MSIRFNSDFSYDNRLRRTVVRRSFGGRPSLMPVPASAFTATTAPYQFMNATRILTAVVAASILLTIAQLGIAKQNDADTASNVNSFPSGKYYMTVSVAMSAATGARDLSVLDPELVQIGNRPFVSGTVCDASYGARRSEFSGQKAFIALDAIVSMQRYPDEE